MQGCKNDQRKLEKDRGNAHLKLKIDTLELALSKIEKESPIAGFAVAIVNSDSVIYQKGFGISNLETNKPYSSKTIQPLASISKTFIGASIMILVDEGKINWDDKVKEYLPYFELYAPYVTDNFTIRDLLTHRSGLKDVSGGTLWYHSDYSREEIIKRLKYLEPVSSYREKPAYQNVMYVVASEIVKVVSGISWDDFLRERVFDKLKMICSDFVNFLGCKVGQKFTGKW